MSKEPIHKDKKAEDKLRDLLKASEEEVARKSRTMEDLEYEEKEEEIESNRQNTALRKDFTYKIFYLMCASIAVVFIIVIASGLGCLILPNSVINTLLITNLGQIIGLFATVVTYLYTKK